jgi:hypothetical protein
MRRRECAEGPEARLCSFFPEALSIGSPFLAPTPFPVNARQIVPTPIATGSEKDAPV